MYFQSIGRFFSSLVWAFPVVCALLCPAIAHAGEVTVFAAASLKNAMDEIAREFLAETGNKAKIVLAGSSALARQIEQGAPADIFISANPGWMDRLEQNGQIDSRTRVDLLENSIVLIAHGRAAEPVFINKGMDLSRMLGEGRLAMAMVNAVPAGIYGKAALKFLEIWDEIEPKVAQTDNVRAALAMVSIGEAPYGIVYATDAAASDNVSVIGKFPAETHPPIVYPVGEVAASDNPVAPVFLRFLLGDTARQAFERQGFKVRVE